MSSEKRPIELAQLAAKRIETAAELLNQLQALQSFEDQELIRRAETHNEAIRLVNRFHSEVEDVIQLLSEYIQIRAKQEGLGLKNGHGENMKRSKSTEDQED